MSRLLSAHLNPRGDLADSEQIASVYDSDGNVLQYSSANRITSESTVVNIGSGPNTNDGDALRTAFIKINNFMEANYWANKKIADELATIEARLDAIETRLTNGGL